MNARRFLTHLLPVLLLPMLLAVLVRVGSFGPDYRTMVRDAGDPDAGMRERGVYWIGTLQKTELLPVVEERLFDEEEDVRDAAAEVMLAYRSTLSVPALERAVFSNLEEARRPQKAIRAMAHPAALDSLERQWRTHPDEEIRNRAYASAMAMEISLNQQMSYFSVGDDVWNRMAQMLASHAVLFPEGRVLLEDGPTSGSLRAAQLPPWFKAE